MARESYEHLTTRASQAVKTPIRGQLSLEEEDLPSSIPPITTGHVIQRQGSNEIHGQMNTAQPPYQSPRPTPRPVASQERSDDQAAYSDETHGLPSQSSQTWSAYEARALYESPISSHQNDPGTLQRDVAYPYAIHELSYHSTLPLLSSSARSPALTTAGSRSSPFSKYDAGDSKQNPFLIPDDDEVSILKEEVGEGPPSKSKRSKPSCDSDDMSTDEEDRALEWIRAKELRLETKELRLETEMKASRRKKRNRKAMMGGSARR